VRYIAGSTLDLNGFSVIGKALISATAGQTGILSNSTATKSTWSGNVQLTGFLRAGGTNAELEISGIISGSAAPGSGGMQSLDNGILRLSGDNTYTGGTTVRAGSTLIIGHSNALGSVGATNTNSILAATLDLNGYDIGSRSITLRDNASRLVNDNTNAAAVVSGAINMLTNRSNAQIGGAGNLTLNGGIATPVAGLGGGFTKVGTGTLTLAASGTYGGNTVVEAGQLVLATSGSLAFFIGAPGTNNAVSGPGTALFQGSFLIDLAGASTNQGDSWTLVSGAGKAYDGNFQVTGFSNNAGTWSLETNGVTYQFSQSSGALTVAGANTNAYNNWASYWQGVDPGFTNTAGTADPDGDGFVNDMEFAFDGNPTVGTPALLTATKAGANAVFRYVARNSGATYEVQSAANLATGPWTNAPVTVTNSADTNNINLPADYTRKEFTVPASGSRFYRVRATLAEE
jgi:autotransporter-associated beta strand protein